ncbi:exodeoxyribonuclease III [Baaleninema sp.]|uniref:exodeoxyribonuclease III n=1 Tax=Baaleninema sp. TaxID=3101197 RepID=UPI003D06367E
MKIATWNVNSIRTRRSLVCDWLDANPVDLLCVQETKVVDEDFPREPFESIGRHVYCSGQKSYNGVALFSRTPLDNVEIGFGALLPEAIVGDLDDQKRAIAGTLNGVRVVNLYVPNGGEYDSDKYRYKLRWLEVLRKYIEVTLDKYDHLCICGDFNIAPDDRDIHTPPGNKPIVGTTSAERDALQEVLSLGLRDPFRKFTEEGGIFSWWDYRGGSFRRNRGWRIDHHYLTPELFDRTISCTIDVEPRKLPKPSDHTPVIVEWED